MSRPIERLHHFPWIHEVFMIEKSRANRNFYSFALVKVYIILFILFFFLLNDFIFNLKLKLLAAIIFEGMQILQP